MRVSSPRSQLTFSAREAYALVILRSSIRLFLTAVFSSLADFPFYLCSSFKVDGQAKNEVEEDRDLYSDDSMVYDLGSSRNHRVAGIFLG